MKYSIFQSPGRFGKSMDWASIVKYWPLIVLWPTLLGYIGFYTFASQTGISFEKIELPTIIGIGLYSVFAFILLYNPRSNRQKPTFGTVLLTLAYLNFLRINPIAIVMLLVFDYQFKYIGFMLGIGSKKKNSKIPYAKKRRMVERRPLNQSFSELVFLVILILIWLFFEENLLTMAFVVYALMFVIYNIKRGTKNWILKALVISLFVPMFISVYYLNDIDYTIFGLSRERAEIELRENKKETGTIVYKSSQFIYLQQDTVNIQIPISEIKLIRKLPYERKGKNGIDGLKEVFENFKN